MRDSNPHTCFQAFCFQGSCRYADSAKSSNNLAEVLGFEPRLTESKSIVLTSYTIPQQNWRHVVSQEVRLSLTLYNTDSFELRDRQNWQRSINLVSDVGFEPTKPEATELQPAETLQRPRSLINHIETYSIALDPACIPATKCS